MSIGKTALCICSGAAISVLPTAHIVKKQERAKVERVAKRQAVARQVAVQTLPCEPLIFERGPMDVDRERVQAAYSPYPVAWVAAYRPAIVGTLRPSQPAEIPEPATIGIFALGFMALAFRRRYKP